MKKKNTSQVSHNLKTRKGRILYLIEQKGLDINDYAKKMKRTKNNLIRDLRDTTEINRLDYILRAYECLNGSITLTWLITGQLPIESARKTYFWERKKPEEKLSASKRIKVFLSENGHSVNTISKILGKDAVAVLRNLNSASDKINVLYVIAIHMCTGVSLDYLLDGIEPKFIFEKTHYDLEDVL